LFAFWNIENVHLDGTILSYIHKTELGAFICKI